MHEQIFLNGVPVGLREQDPYERLLANQRAAAPAKIVGFLVGAIGGAILGNSVHKGATGAAVGAVTGSVGGLIGGSLLASLLRKTPTTIRAQDCNMEKFSADERKAIFDKAKANLEAAGIPFDGTVWSDETKFAAFTAEVYKVAGCSPPMSTAGKP